MCRWFAAHIRLKRCVLAPRTLKNNLHQIPEPSSQKEINPEALKHPLQLRRENHPLPTFKATIDVQRIPALQNHIINGKHMAPLGVLATLMFDVWRDFKGDGNATILENIEFKLRCCYQVKTCFRAYSPR